MKIYTLGYGGRDPSELLQLLADHGIRTDVEVHLLQEAADDEPRLANLTLVDNAMCAPGYVPDAIRYDLLSAAEHE
jgi:hypothetical protein